MTPAEVHEREGRSIRVIERGGTRGPLSLLLRSTGDDVVRLRGDRIKLVDADE